MRHSSCRSSLHPHFWVFLSSLLNTPKLPSQMHLWVSVPWICCYDQQTTMMQTDSRCSMFDQKLVEQRNAAHINAVYRCNSMKKWRHYGASMSEHMWFQLLQWLTLTSQLDFCTNQAFKTFSATFFFKWKDEENQKVLTLFFLFQSKLLICHFKGMNDQKLQTEESWIWLEFGIQKNVNNSKNKKKWGFFNNAQTMFQWKAPRRSKSKRCLMIEAVSNWRNTNLSSVENDTKRNIEGTRQAEKKGRC